jgi:putative endonuclease
MSQLPDLTYTSRNPHPERMPRHFYVYVLANRSGVLYVGVTGNLLHRLHQHRSHAIAGFARRYNITRLVYYEETADVAAAIAREKQVKDWRRSKKVALIEAENPAWDDLAIDWFEADQPIADPSLRSG